MEAPVEYVRGGQPLIKRLEDNLGRLPLRDSQVSIKQEVKGVICHAL